MHKAFVILPLLGWAGVAALVHHAPVLSLPEADQGTVVVVRSPPIQAAGPVPAAQAPRRVMPPAGDRAALVRELQKELTRVGCYDGGISGVWTATTRRAMRAFTDRVNAKLPTGKPDFILLSLVQGHRKKACGVACPAGQREDATGRCVPDAIARATKQPAPNGADADPPTQTPQIIIGSTTAAAAVAARMRQPDPDVAPSRAKRAPVPPQSTDVENARGSAAKSASVQRAGVRKGKRRRAARRAKSGPPAVVQSLIRNVKSALGIY